MIKNHIRDIEIEFDKKFVLETGLMHYHPKEMETDLKSFLKSSQKSLLEKVVEEIERYKIGGKNLPPEEQRIDDLLEEICSSLKEKLSEEINELK